MNALNKRNDREGLTDARPMDPNEHAFGPRPACNAAPFGNAHCVLFARFQAPLKREAGNRLRHAAYSAIEF